MNSYSKTILNSLSPDIFKIISDSADELGLESYHSWRVCKRLNSK